MIQNPDAIPPSVHPEVKKPPQTRCIFSAAIWGVVGMLISFVVWFIVWVITLSNVSNILLPGFFASINLIFLFVFMGVAISFFEWASLSPWISSKRQWYLISTLAFIVLLIGGFAVLNATSVQNLERVAYMHRSIRPYAEKELYKFDMIIGAAVGIAFGLIFGLLQSFVLTCGRRRWWLASMITWSMVWAVLGLFHGMNAKIFD